MGRTRQRLGSLLCALAACALSACGGGGGGGGTAPAGTPSSGGQPAPPGGQPAPAGAQRLDRAEFVSASADSRFVVYVGIPSSTAGLPANASQFQNVFIHDIAAQSRRIVSVDPTGASAGNAISQAARPTAEGQFVVFTSRATNLVPGPAYPVAPPGTPGNSFNQLFVRDVAAGTTRLVSSNPTGSSAEIGRAS